MRHCFTLDLKNDPQLIQEYEAHHKKMWPEITASIKEAGITNMELYRFEDRLFMIMDVKEDFSFERKQKIDRENIKVQVWEELMWRYQQALPGAQPGEKWILMKKIFQLEE